MNLNRKAHRNLLKHRHLLKLGRLDLIWSRSERPKPFHRLNTSFLSLWDAGPIRIVWYKINH